MCYYLVDNMNEKCLIDILTFTLYKERKNYIKMTLYEKITIIPVNECKIIDLPFKENSQFVRTGTIQDKNSILHATHHAYLPEYVHMNEEEKSNLVSKFISGVVDRTEWKELDDGAVSMLNFEKYVRSMVSDFYKVIKTKNNNIKSVFLRNVIETVLCDDGKREIYENILKIIPLDDIIGSCGIVRLASKNCKHMDVYVEDVLKRSIMLSKKKLENGRLDEHRLKYFVSKFKVLMKSVLKESEMFAYRMYIKNLKNKKTYIDKNQLETIRDRLDIDVYMIDATTRLPYTLDCSINDYKTRKSIILLRIDEYQYEVIGRVIPNTRKVQRSFEYNDNFITMLYMFQFHPKQFVNKYKHLSQYIQQENEQDIDSEPNDEPNDEQNIDQPTNYGFINEGDDDTESDIYSD